MHDFTDEELLLRLQDPEDHFTERKVFSDSSDWLKTAVAFANSAQVGSPAVLYIGVRNNGTPEGSEQNLESIQQSFGKKLQPAYPPISYYTRILTRDGARFLAVVIPGSADRPHFAGPSYIRLGSSSVVASPDQFSRLIASRAEKVRLILEWKDREVTVRSWDPGWENPYGRPFPDPEPTERRAASLASVVDCNSFYVTLRSGMEHCYSAPLQRVMLSFDHDAERLLIEVGKEA